MDIKGFIKPDVNKYLFLVLLIFLVLIVGYLKSLFLVINDCSTGSCDDAWTNTFSDIMKVLALPMFVSGNLDIEVNTMTWIMLLILESAYLYILACMFSALLSRTEKAEDPSLVLPK